MQHEVLSCVCSYYRTGVQTSGNQISASSDKTCSISHLFFMPNSCLEREVSPDETVTVKKRKVSDSGEGCSTNYNSRLISFENLYSRNCEWVSHLLSRLEDGTKHLDTEDKQLLLEETEAEVQTYQEKLLELISEGECLINGKSIVL